MKMNTENRPVAIRLSGVKKMYKLGQIGGGTLRGDLQSWWARVRGKEDPNTKIGTDQRLFGKTFMALNGIDLTVYQGEALGIIGGNGAGKSTMLKLLSRVTAPTEGEIDIYGRIASMLEVGTGFHGEMTGRENVYLNGAILGMTKAEIDAKMDQIIEFSEVRDFIDTPVKRYSSGMYVKLAFSVAAHLDSEIMIMDEVLAVGDMAFQKKCLDKMRDAAKKEGRTVLYVSHNMNTIRQLCDRCVVLNQGKIIFIGSVEEAIEVYLNRSDTDDSVDIDLSSMPHVDKQCNFNIRMKRILLEDKVVPIYFDTDTMKLKCSVSVNKPLKDVCFRMTLRTSADVGVGTLWTTKMDFTSVGNADVMLEFDLSSIPKGKLNANIGFYQISDGGSFVMLDHVTRAFSFEINQKPRAGSIIWDPGYWGHIRFPDVKAEIINC